MAAARPDALANLACAFLAGPWTLYGLLKRSTLAFPHHARQIRQTARRVFKAFGQTAPSFATLLLFLRRDPKTHAIAGGLVIGQYFWLPETMAPRGAAAQTWNVPAFTTTGQLAEWLGVAPPALDWLADVAARMARATGPKLRHYVYRWRPRRQGRFRLIESPKRTLKQIQRRILREILERLPPHSAAHGFRVGRSILSYAAPHVGQDIVLRFDLRDFFAAVPASRIHALFRTAGYPEQVARLLTGLCTSRVPLDVWEQRPDPRETDETLWSRLRAPHLPQGAPTSPALANLCAYGLDVRLQALAQSLGAIYTRYADDLAFSGGKLLECGARRFQVTVAVIAAEEGFALHFQKSRFMRRGVRQQLAGIVVNERPNIRRALYDELKAILTNCVRHGPAAQNRAGVADFRNHLLGRIAYVEMLHRERGAKLRSLFDRIEWG